jgi:hypothetical protein
MLTITPDIAEAVSNLRARGYRASLGELVKLGAESKLVELDQLGDDDVERSRRRMEFLDKVATGKLLDITAGDEAHEQGWGRSA